MKSLPEQTVERQSTRSHSPSHSQKLSHMDAEVESSQRNSFNSARSIHSYEDISIELEKYFESVKEKRSQQKFDQSAAFGSRSSR